MNPFEMAQDRLKIQDRMKAGLKKARNPHIILFGLINCNDLYKLYSMSIFIQRSSKLAVQLMAREVLKAPVAIEPIFAPLEFVGAFLFPNRTS